ncbi:MAG: hypothetical protein UZ14_CFX002002954 [Chloroflexi bacterium OLB14]|nr:MAG: hypothetical protein UZ14_CFX002002954 [Chloroflexi bacterium OLB14]
MTNGICPNCGSKNIYKSENTSWSRDGLNIQALGDKVTEVFATESYLCLDCRHIQMHVAEYSAAIFGKGKSLKESIQASSNWKKVN